MSSCLLSCLPFCRLSTRPIDLLVGADLGGFDGPERWVRLRTVHAVEPPGSPSAPDQCCPQAWGVLSGTLPRHQLRSPVTLSSFRSSPLFPKPPSTPSPHVPGSPPLHPHPDNRLSVRMSRDFRRIIYTLEFLSSPAPTYRHRCTT